LWDPLTGGITVSDSGGPLNLTLPARGSAFVVLGRETEGAQRPMAGEPFKTLTLNPDWRLRFDGPDAPAPTKLRELSSWTELPGAKYFSGLGVYTATITLEEDPPARAVLHFDDVREAAEVKVNGKSVGVVFSAPWDFDVTRALRKGRNELEVTVANLPVNRFIGSPDMDLAALRAKYGARFQAPEEKEIMKGVPAPSGLIGVVRLVLER
jgi:hypothetical protein